jgi:CRP-like cAMP-binding protein
MHMQRASNTRTGNYLLDALPPESLERLQPNLEPVALVLKARVQQVEHVYFPVSGLISVVATMKDGATIETGLIAREGMYSVSAILSDDAPSETAMVQLPGHALRVKARLLRKAMQADAALQKLLLRYTQATLSAVAQSAACNRLHLLEQRCARWLLAFHDRAETDSFRTTHEFLAMMLGVRRPGITFVAQAFQANGLITYSHGTMRVADRSGLEAAACECYRVIRDEFSRVFAASPTSRSTLRMSGASRRDRC